MKSSITFRTLLALACLILSVVSVAAQSGVDDTPLTNAAIVKLVKANFKEKTIISIIGSRNSRFDLSTERMIDLKRSGVSEKIILAMLAHQQGMEIDSAWDDEFFNQGPNKADLGSNQPGGSSNGSSTDIFGSSGGSRGTTKTRGGGGGSSSGDIITTGTATVRILRPPAEAGAPMKLERVVTLTNDSIVELVEAGFSEGTIIRRIEQSPVDFDLSPAKIADLQKKRVSEKILTAMRVASGETSNVTAPPRSNGTPVQ